MRVDLYEQAHRLGDRYQWLADDLLTFTRSLYEQGLTTENVRSVLLIGGVPLVMVDAAILCTGDKK